MNGMILQNLKLKAGTFVVGEINLSIKAGEYFVLMGHTGAGKSLLMKSICGIQQIDSGEIFIGDRNVTNLQPGVRQIGYVPQDSGLFPHLDVSENIAFALDIIGVSQSETKTRINRIAEEIGISGLLKRRIVGLSGGERQKVSLARALSRQPQVLLLDEPVSALDEKTHEDICSLLLRVHREHHLTTIHICHNRNEALKLGNRVGAMNAGKLISIEERIKS